MNEDGRVGLAGLRMARGGIIVGGGWVMPAAPAVCRNFPLGGRLGSGGSGQGEGA
jgi:hypothetical protein